VKCSPAVGAATAPGSRANTVWYHAPYAAAFVQRGHLLDQLDAHYRGERYRVSPGLRERAWLALLGAPASP